MTATNAYIVTDVRTGDFKIGHSKDYLARFVKLRLKPDLEKSFYLESDCLTGVEIERVLLRHFDDIRIRRGREDGSTEWFQARSYGRVLEFIQEKLCATGLVQLHRVPMYVVRRCPNRARSRRPYYSVDEINTCNAAALADLEEFLRLAGTGVRRGRILHFWLSTGRAEPKLIRVLSAFGCASIFDTIYTLRTEAGMTLISLILSPLDAHLAAPSVREIQDLLAACAYPDSARELELIIDEFGEA